MCKWANVVYHTVTVRSPIRAARLQKTVFGLTPSALFSSATFCLPCEPSVRLFGQAKRQLP